MTVLEKHNNSYKSHAKERVTKYIPTMTGVRKRPSAILNLRESYRTRATDMLMGESRVMFR